MSRSRREAGLWVSTWRAQSRAAFAIAGFGCVSPRRRRAGRLSAPTNSALPTCARGAWAPRGLVLVRDDGPTAVLRLFPTLTHHRIVPSPGAAWPRSAWTRPEDVRQATLGASRRRCPQAAHSGPFSAHWQGSPRVILKDVRPTVPAAWRRRGHWRWPTSPPPTVPSDARPRFECPHCHGPLGADDRCEACGTGLPRDESP